MTVQQQPLPACYLRVLYTTQKGNNICLLFTPGTLAATQIHRKWNSKSKATVCRTMVCTVEFQFARAGTPNKNKTLTTVSNTPHTFSSQHVSPKTAIILPPSSEHEEAGTSYWWWLHGPATDNFYTCPLWCLWRLPYRVKNVGQKEIVVTVPLLAHNVILKVSSRGKVLTALDAVSVWPSTTVQLEMMSEALVPEIGLGCV